MKCIVIGGTGFLGHFVAGELFARGHAVTAVGRPPAPQPGYLPPSAEVVIGNIHEMSDDTLLRMFDGAGAVVFGGGADGRDLFPVPAIDGYRTANVAPMGRLVPLLRRAGVPRLVILGSFYTALARKFPALRLGELHPYVQSRLEQTRLSFELASPDLSVGVLELPYIFGAAPGRGTLWGFYVRHIQDNDPVPVPSGGTACVTARQVGQATAGACERVSGHRHYAVVDSNHSYRELYSLFADAMGIYRTFRLIAQDEAMAEAEKQLERLAMAGKEHGMHPVGLAELQAVHACLDPAPAMEDLGYGPDNLPAALAATVRATLQFNH
jgi:nucleoside-diphosphate-sugar epimerase